MATWKKTVNIPNCGNTWCDMDVGCRGHNMTMDYSTVTDICSIVLDGSDVLVGGDGLFSAIVELINQNPYLESYRLDEK